MPDKKSLSADDRERYSWQLAVEGFGEEGQCRLKNSSVLVSRVGGVGGNVALQLAAAGIGKLLLAHAGPLRTSDLNRQTLMDHSGLGRPRIELAARRLREFNPELEIEGIEENINEVNAPRLVAKADAVASCAPLFSERLLLNQAAVAQNKPLVDCAMFDMDVQLTTVVPGRSACLACLYPKEPPGWQRRFPVFGAVAGAIGCLGAMEIIKVLTGLGQPLAGQMLVGDLSDMTFRKVRTQRNPACPVCSSIRPKKET
jgi:molybdopterin/thiamine biosynthesis adenylyltransferase